MISYTQLLQYPSAFVSLTGLRPSDFDALFRDFELAHQERILHSTVTKRHKQPRRHVVGSGPRHKLSLQDRLLLTLIWLRIYPTYELLGYFFSLNKTNAEDNQKDILATLDLLAHVSIKRPDPNSSKIHSVQEVMEAFPDVRLIIDAKEQQIHRPKSSKENNEQKPYYSGKKKAHTLKTQIGVDPGGKIEAVSESVPGGANHDINLLRSSGLLDQLAADEAAMMDKGYDGITNDYPDKRLYLPHKARRNHPITEQQKAENRIHSRYRIIVEHVNAQLNRFQTLAQVWRHDRQDHNQTFRVVAGLVNYRTQARPLKTYNNAVYDS